MDYKSGVPILVTYQAVSHVTGLTIIMDVYDETYALDVGQSSGSMAEIGATGRYYKAFTPDAAGEWIAMCYEDGGGGEVVKAFRVTTVDEFGIKTVVDAVQAKTDLIGASVAPAGEYDTQMGTGERASASALSTLDGKVVTVDTVVDGIQTDLSNVTDGLGAIKDAVDAIGSPAMLG